jgi:sensor histidine kinase YesM
MGRRLNVQVDIPPDHETALVPPMAIGTLVENAIKHGLGPRGKGGTLTISARRDGDALVVGVGDDGWGFACGAAPAWGFRTRAHG